MMQRQDYDDAVYAIERKSEELRSLVGEFERIMDGIPDKWDMIILRDYYALGWTDKRIAEEIGFDKSTVWKRRTRAINTLDCQLSY